MSGGIPSRGSRGRFFTSSGARGRGSDNSNNEPLNLADTNVGRFFPSSGARGRGSDNPSNETLNLADTNIARRGTTKPSAPLGRVSLPRGPPVSQPTPRQAAAAPTHTSGPAVLVEPPSRPESAESVGGGLDLLRARLHQHWYIRYPMPVTLKTVFSRLGLQGDRFTSQILCYQCHRHFERDTPSDALCPDCETELFQPATRQLFQSVLTSITGTSAPEPARRPYLVSPVQLLSDSIREFFQRPGMVGAVNAWKIRPRTHGESRSIQDGKVWRNIKGHDGQSFFYGDSSKTEIRLGTTIGLDWFGRKTSNYGPSHSS
ncbi:hypothetical protein B0H10DRAFT_1952247 [Mycena sp. CBHHK59/15]|nr:hypothetical protein B0H10DRAFT_1952247 [Mycena sp. CBHHK59/15]